jgi:hypothetical protein
MKNKILISISADSEEKTACWNGKTWDILNASEQCEQSLTPREFENVGFAILGIRFFLHARKMTSLS